MILQKTRHFDSKSIRTHNKIHHRAVCEQNQQPLPPSVNRVKHSALRLTRLENLIKEKQHQEKAAVESESGKGNVCTKIKI